MSIGLIIFLLYYYYIPPTTTFLLFFLTAFFFFLGKRNIRSLLLSLIDELFSFALSNDQKHLH